MNKHRFERLADYALSIAIGVIIAAILFLELSK